MPDEKAGQNGQPVHVLGHTHTGQMRMVCIACGGWQRGICEHAMCYFTGRRIREFGKRCSLICRSCRGKRARSQFSIREWMSWWAREWDRERAIKCEKTRPMNTYKPPQLPSKSVRAPPWYQIACTPYHRMNHQYITSVDWRKLSLSIIAAFSISSVG